MPQPYNNTGPASTDRLFMVGFEGTCVTPELERFLDRYTPTGFVVFSRNIENPGQLRSLTGEISEYYEERMGSSPLFAIDQEGGTVCRLRPPHFYALPGAMAMGQEPSGELAAKAGNYIGRQLAALGVHVDFAPVLDLNSNRSNPQLGLRSFGSEPTHVMNRALRFAEGMMKTAS